MKKLIPFYLSIFFLGASLFVNVGCKKDPCLDLVLLDSLRVEMESWYVIQPEENQIISDRNGISQSLNASETYTHILETHVEDDCGNVSASYDFSMQYTTSISPIHFMVNIRGAAIDFGGYTIEIAYRRTMDEPISRTATYDLYTNASRDDQATFELIDNYLVDYFNYGTVLEISYTQMSLPTAVQKIWFAKQYGIIRFSDVGGNIFTRKRDVQP